jgi:hypothetical protein
LVIANDAGLTNTHSQREARCGVQTTGPSRRLADDGRHFIDPAVRFARIFVGIVNAAPVVICSVAQHARCANLCGEVAVSAEHGLGVH